ncbi:Scr1 family TA system antitoxin-like transcriptional regulator [Micromonospora inyonensis]|uniref:Helix-turn-helix domain-containing protein n=1 Tax=Micromonospora inyonensis TaxID=47866 RepID=A0A1C6SFC9_9ACTN|nr:Scr1 family TA system antitoxin-like transcriptional regulator [Micromonospora inyonensis]SCL28174.1 Helix-turn-helix domain-containing protein [Micromonospora inyonensis]
MTEDGASTVPRRQLGRMLRELRLAAGVTLDAAVVALQCSRQKVWRIETGGGSFTLLEFPFVRRAVPELPVVHQESLTGALYLDRPAELAAYERVWASLDSLALRPEESRRFIGKIAERLHHG